MTTAEDVALTLAYQRELNRIADAVADAVEEVFAGLPQVVDAFMRRFIEEAGPLVRAGQAEAIDLASAYLTELMGDVPPSVDLLLPGVPWDAPFLRTWRKLKVGDPFELARKAGAGQARSIGFDAANHAATGRMVNTGLREVGFRRVTSPGACDWCQLVSVQRYTSREAASLKGGKGVHGSCKCVVVTILGKRDPGRTINHTRYQELKAAGVPRKLAADKRAKARR